MTGIVIKATDGRFALTAPGYFYVYPKNFGAVASLLYPAAATNVSNGDFDLIRQLHTNGVTADAAAISNLPAQIPLTVQGASEDFITSTMGQVVANTNTNAVQLNGSIFTARDQVRTHVTNETNRVIAAL